MTINYTDKDVQNGQLIVKTGGQPFTVNVDVPVQVTIKSAGDGILNLSSGNDLFFVHKQIGAVHINVDAGPGNDVLNNASSKTLVNYEYHFANGQSLDGADGIFNFHFGHDHLVLNGVTQAQFEQNFTVTNAPGSAGAVITDGTNDGWSVQLIGVHQSAAQLLADGAFTFA